ncbi:MAG TPA: CBS domain-containing protein [Candidatus Saccharimonadales bacterium]|nr:CBS domain-containing protein [Candidatus Saccharimonadales bacterium]
MISSIFGATLLLIGLLALALQRFYSCVPAKELKRLAARSDHLAMALYRPVAYGASMRLFLWILFGIATAAGLLVALVGLQTWAAFGVVLVVLTVVVWLQSVRLTVHSARLAVIASPALHKALQYVHAPLHFLAKLVGHVRQHEPHSGLYEKSDLLALLRQQKEQLDNRISMAELELIERAATFEDLKAADVVLPWAQVKLVNKTDAIGPILLEELHSSGQRSFLVYQDKPEHVVGTLFLRDAVRAKAGGQVADIMHHNLCFVHEDFSLRQVLEAFRTTGQFMVVVINAFEEAVGVITLQHLLVQLVGDIEEGFDAFEDRTAVASYKPQLQLAEEPVVDEMPEQQSPSPDTTEVIK